VNDIRLKKLADILINHSLEIKKNDYFMIAGGIKSIPLIKEVFNKSIELGANPFIRIGVEELAEIFFKKASDQQLKFLPPISKFEVQKIDAKLSIMSPENTRYMTNIDPKKQSICSIAQKPIQDIFLKRAANKELKWCITQFPTHASAQDAEMSISEYEDFIFNAAHVSIKNPIDHWKKTFKIQEKIKEYLEEKKNIHIYGKDTDLKIKVENRKWINCYGKENFPDGEIFTGPIENSAKGHISYSFPAVHGGRLIDDIQLWFDKGKVVKARASTGENFLKTMLKMDKGSERIGEFAFGTNYGIKKYTRNTLFDEKIGGTIHIAIGLGFPETGSKNNSSLHWDMVCDLRKNGEVYADDELFYKNGKFLI
jgi:aminopeptidase